MTRRLQRFLALVLLASPSTLFALGLGDIQLHSALNEPLDADIELVSAAPDELSSLKASLANRETFARYPHIGAVLPAVGYDAAQRAALRETIDRADADVVVAATPVDIARLIAPAKRVVRARYEFAENGALGEVVDRWIAGQPHAV